MQKELKIVFNNEKNIKEKKREKREKRIDRFLNLLMTEEYNEE